MNNEQHGYKVQLRGSLNTSLNYLTDASRIISRFIIVPLLYNDFHVSLVEYGYLLSPFLDGVWD